MKTKPHSHKPGSRLRWNWRRPVGGGGDGGGRPKRKKYKTNEGLRFALPCVITHSRHDLNTVALQKYYYIQVTLPLSCNV